MNLTKKSKLTALIIVAVMCLAIIVTASVIFAPKFYKGSDTEIDNAANNPYSGYDAGGYGMTQSITFDKSNMALALARQDENDHVWIYFPSTIYMDVTENLQSLKYGYHFYAHFGGSGNTDNYHTLFHSAMGYYLDGNGNQNGKYVTAWQNDANMMR